MFNLEIFDINFHRYGILQNYKMATYTKEYTNVGSFEVVCSADESNIDLIKKERIIWFEDNVAGIIQYINKSRNESGQITVKGSLIGEIFNWRYVWPTLQATAPANEIMESVVKSNCMFNQLLNRNYNFLEIQQTALDLPNITKQKTGGTVLEALTELSEANNIGFDVGFYPRIKKVKFKVLSGENRTPGNPKKNKPVFFSQDLNNIIRSEYTVNTGDYRNTALVAAEKSETERVSLEVSNVKGDLPVGFYRRETYVDARDLQSTEVDENGEEIPIPDDLYYKMLNERGLEKLSEAKEIENFSGEIRSDADTIFHFGKDFFLGDTVGIIDINMGISTTAVVTAVTVTQDENGYTVEPEFGYGQPTLINKLKRKGVV